MLATLALLLGSISPCLIQQAIPFQTLASSYTPGEQLCFEVTPNGERGFLAEGATITFLDMHASQPTAVPTLISIRQEWCSASRSVSSVLGRVRRRS